jgi:hypothetical protein
MDIFTNAAIVILSLRRREIAFTWLDKSRLVGQNRWIIFREKTPGNKNQK